MRARTRPSWLPISPAPRHPTPTTHYPLHSSTIVSRTNTLCEMTTTITTDFLLCLSNTPRSCAPPSSKASSRENIPPQMFLHALHDNNFSCSRLSHPPRQPQPHHLPAATQHNTTHTSFALPKANIFPFGANTQQRGTRQASTNHQQHAPTSQPSRSPRISTPTHGHTLTTTHAVHSALMNAKQINKI